MYKKAKRKSSKYIDSLLPQAGEGAQRADEGNSKKFVVTDNKLTRKLKEKTKKNKLEITHLSPCKLQNKTPNKLNQERVISPCGTTYREFARTENATVYTTETPDKTNSNLRFTDEVCLSVLRHPEQQSSCSQESFDFSVDQNALQFKKPRRISQNRVMNSSAADFLREAGADVPNSKKIHWSHLQAIWFDGEQEPDNLVPGTQESNYSTLHLIERPIAELVSEKKTTVHVGGTVTYHPTRRLPLRIQYQLSVEGQNKTQLMTYPMDTRPHKKEERDVAKALIACMVSPPKHYSTRSQQTFFKPEELDTNSSIEVQTSMTFDK